MELTLSLNVSKIRMNYIVGSYIIPFVQGR